MPTVSDHAHTWGPVERVRNAGHCVRRCTGGDDYCSAVTLDTYLYCTECGAQVVSGAEPGTFRHADPDESHAPVPETGEAPDEDEDEDDER